MSARQGEGAVELESPSLKVLRRRNGLFIPPMGCQRVNGLVVASPSVDIVRALAPNDGDFRAGQRRLQFDDYSAGNVVLQLQSLGPRSLMLAGPQNAPVAASTSWVETRTWSPAPRMLPSST